MALTVYCGTPSDELCAMRESLIAQIQQAGMMTVTLDNWRDDASLVEQLRARISQADAFIAMLSYRRGPEPASLNGKSLLEAEYDLAREFDKPLAVLMPHRQTDIASRLRHRAIGQEPMYREAQQAFIDRVEQESRVLHFNDEAELSRLVLDCLRVWSSETAVTGPHQLTWWQHFTEGWVEHLAERTAQKLLAAQHTHQHHMAEQALKYQDALRLNPGELVFGQPRASSQFQSDVFVIMPFADEFTVVYADIIKPLAADLKLRCARGDEFSSTRGSVIEEVWAALNGCRFVLADISGGNDNVYYELGIAHTLNKPAIIMTQAQTPEDVPFDIRHLRYIAYQNTDAGRTQLRTDLDMAITWLLADLGET